MRLHFALILVTSWKISVADLCQDTNPALCTEENKIFCDNAIIGQELSEQDVEELLAGVQASCPLLCGMCEETAAPSPAAAPTETPAPFLVQILGDVPHVYFDRTTLTVVIASKCTVLFYHPALFYFPFIFLFS